MLPIKLKLENFMSHSDSTIDFTKFKVALILGSYNGEMDISNGSGKSVLLEAISWVLFGKARQRKKDGLVKKDKRNCRVEFIFDVDGTSYRITRRRDKIIGENDVVFEQVENGVYKNISCDTNTATDDKIVSILNVNYEVFLNSVYFKQNDINVFAEATTGKRKDIIKSMLKMDIWDDYQYKARDAAKELSAKLEEKNKLKVDIDDIKEKIEELDTEIKDNQAKLNSYNSEYSKLNAEVITKTSAHQLIISNLQTGPEQLKKVQKEHAEFKKRSSQINSKLGENQSTINNNKSVINDLQQKINNLNEKIKLKKDINLSDINNKLVAGKTKEKVMREQINHLQQDIILNEECPTCDKKLTKEDIRDLKVKKTKQLVELKSKHAEIVAKLSKAEEKAKQMSVLFDEGNKAELDRGKLEIKLSKSKSLIETALSESKQLTEELKKSQNRDFEKDLLEIKNSFNKEELDKLDGEIQDLTIKLANLRSLCDNLNVDLGSKVKTQEEYKKLQVEQEKLKEELKKLNEDFIIYEKLKQYFGKDGIQAVIIENVIEDLENYTNETLTKICNEPTSISIKTQKQSDSGSWNETFEINIDIGGRSDDFESLSGGEQFRVSLSLRLALSKILSKRMGGNLKFLLLDEVSSSLDDKGMKMFVDTVKQIGNDMKVLVITHDEKIKEQFDDVIIVNKTAEGSKASN